MHRVCIARCIFISCCHCMQKTRRFHYFLIYKPYGMLSQFRPGEGQRGLGELYDFPKEVYSVGRLDADSEGLLLLTDDTRINRRLLDPLEGHPRTYWVQVEGEISDEAIERLSTGVSMRIDGKEYRTRPALAGKMEAPVVPDRNPPIRYRKSVPDSWLELTLTEGRNRQVRRMTAAVGYPTLRLIRHGIGTLKMENPYPGKVVELDQALLYKALKLS